MRVLLVGALLAALLVPPASAAEDRDGVRTVPWDTPTPVWPQTWRAVAADGYLARALGPRSRPEACA